MKTSLITRLEAHHKLYNRQLNRNTIIQFIDELLAVLFPELGENTSLNQKEISVVLDRLKYDLKFLLISITNESELNEDVSELFFDRLEGIYDLLLRDILSIESGDPAAKDEIEVIQSYPGFYAIAIYRIAHLLHGFGVKRIPRILTEYAHQKTGIDIHPGAQIGSSFCIDHGTGVVIGETTIIGNNVKLYQGVTLGALSVTKKLEGIKRHPTIQDNVVIYAGATILGGETVIGANSVIGGNAWITSSVEPGSKVFNRPTTIIKERKDVTVN